MIKNETEGVFVLVKFVFILYNILLHFVFLTLDSKLMGCLQVAQKVELDCDLKKAWILWGILGKGFDTKEKLKERKKKNKFTKSSKFNFLNFVKQSYCGRLVTKDHCFRNQEWQWM